ncbi:MAG: flagellar biosynthesis protein FlhF [Peptococcaceae bacterium]|nr:flagellar biosynthesis protein FlhF [Peptococcaceae bacterium]
MKVKRYVASDIQEAMARVKAELGEDAVILHVRQVKEGGVLGFFARTKTEVTAALEDKKPTVQVAAPLPPLTFSEPKPNPEDEMRELRRVLGQVSRQLKDMGNGAEPTGKLAWLRAELLDKELDDKLVKNLLTSIEESIPSESSQDEVREQLGQSLLGLMPEPAPITLAKEGPLIVALVGPTGVGKTTTVAKLAANFALVDKHKVALVTADTYRVAAVDQLRTFAEIIRVPIEVAVSPSAIQQAIARHQDKEIILIDTAGRSPNNRIHMSELRAFLDKAQPDRVILTLSATTRGKDLLDLVQKFDLPSIDSLIFTKIDETTTLGGIFNLVNFCKKPLAYLTNGQNVPDDIALANSDYIVQRFLGREV